MRRQATLSAHRVLLSKLMAARQPGQAAPWVFTTNYDLAVEWASEQIGTKVINGFDGLHRRAFSPHNFDLGWRNTHAKGQAQLGSYHLYLAKLHGSLSWVESDAEVIEKSTSALWSTLQAFLNGTGSSVPGLMVLPSGAKYFQTVGFILGEMFRRFAEFTSRPQSALIANGFSFRDEHINRLLLSGLQNPTFHLVICLPELARVDDQIDTSTASPWAQKLLDIGSPQVTVIGGAPDAYFGSLAGLLPDPVLFDEKQRQMRILLREMKP